MAIQFQCPGCSQPIEIDDVFAGRNVGCPYCKRVVTAPSQSTLEIPATPVARPASSTAPPLPPQGGFGSPPPPAPPTSRERTAQRLGNFGLGAGCVSFLVFALLMFNLMSIVLSKLANEGIVQPTREDIEKVLGSMQNEPWLLWCTMGSIVFAVIGLALSLTSLAMHARGNWRGVFGAILCGLAGLCFCSGFVASAFGVK